MADIAFDHQTDTVPAPSQHQHSRAERLIRLVILAGFAFVLVIEAWMLLGLFRLP